MCHHIRAAGRGFVDGNANLLRRELPQVSAYFQTGGLVDAILNQGMPAPIDVQVNTRDLNLTYSTAQELASRIRRLPGVGGAGAAPLSGLRGIPAPSSRRAAMRRRPGPAREKRILPAVLVPGRR